jgi:hypothetical protein
MFIKNLEEYLNHFPFQMRPMLDTFSEILSAIDPSSVWDQKFFNHLSEQYHNPMHDYWSSFGFSTEDKIHENYEFYTKSNQKIPTRPFNTHDFFHALCWLTWPKSKSTLWNIHDLEGSQRTTRRNALTLWDECGIVIISAHEHIAQLVHDMDWHTLFISEKQSWLENHTQIFVFGHALMEQACQPYIGWCAKALCFTESKKWFENSHNDKINHLDQFLSFIIKNDLTHPQQLSPFPMLGIPGFWHAQDDIFYKNTDYFRQGRAKKSITRYNPLRLPKEFEKL